MFSASVWRVQQHSWRTHIDHLGGHPRGHPLGHPSIHPLGHPEFTEYTRDATLEVTFGGHPRGHPVGHPSIHPVGHPEFTDYTRDATLEVTFGGHPRGHPVGHPSIHPLGHPEFTPRVHPGCQSGGHLWRTSRRALSPFIFCLNRKHYSIVFLAFIVLSKAEYLIVLLSFWK
jgi:hypothetical protein